MDLLVGWLEQVTGYTYLAPPNKHSRNMTSAINLPTCTIKSELFTVVKIPLKTNPRLYYQPKRATTLVRGLKLTMVIDHLLKGTKTKKKQIQEYWQISYPNNEPLVQNDFPFSNRCFLKKQLQLLTHLNWYICLHLQYIQVSIISFISHDLSRSIGDPWDPVVIGHRAAASRLAKFEGVRLPVAWRRHTEPRKCVAPWNSKSNEF